MFATSIITILGIVLGFSQAGGASDDWHTVVIDEADETAAIRDRSIVRTGDIVRFQMFAFTREAVAVEFSDQEAIETHFSFVELEYNCKTLAHRRIRYGAVNALDMSIEHSETVKEDWAGATWWPFAGYACSWRADGTTSFPRYPSALEFARAAAGLQAQAAARDQDGADGTSTRRTSGFTIGGIDPADCSTPELRGAAALDIDESEIENGSKMSVSMLAQAKLQHVNSICASLMVLSGLDPLAEPDLIPTRYWYALSFHQCKSSWNGTCESTGAFTVPEGFQICSKTYKQDGSGREYRLELTPGDWIEDGTTPLKFRTYNLRMFSSGGGAIFDQTSANIKVSDLWITFLSDRLDTEQRSKRGCDMPQKPAPAPKPVKPDPALPYVQNKFAFPTPSAVDRFHVIMTAPTGGQSRTHYIIEVFDSFIDNRWERYREGVEVMGPGDIRDWEVHKYHATCWRFRSQYLTASGWRAGVSYSQKC